MTYIAWRYSVQFPKTNYLDPEGDPGHHDNEAGGDVGVEHEVAQPPNQIRYLLLYVHVQKVGIQSSKILNDLSRKPAQKLFTVKKLDLKITIRKEKLSFYFVCVQMKIGYLLNLKTTIRQVKFPVEYVAVQSCA